MKTIIVDVRTEKEFLEGSYPGAINLPVSSFESAQFDHFKEYHIALLCNTGSRAEKARKKLDHAGFKQVSLLKIQMTQVVEQAKVDNTIWSVDRQFRLALGILLGLAILTNIMYFSTTSISILVLLFSGLLYSSITDNCYLKEGIMILPWNKKVKSAYTSPVFNVKSFG